MNRVGVFYATREGHARKVAARIAAALVADGLEVAVHDVKDPEATAALARSEAIVVVGSVHLGKHERELVDFARTHRASLNRMRSAFVSVSGAESAAERGTAADAREKGSARAAAQLDAFTEATGWHPTHVQRVAGALPYTRYNPLTRWIMKRIAASEALPTDTSRDFEFTDWPAIEGFADELADELRAPEARAADAASEGAPTNQRNAG